MFVNKYESFMKFPLMLMGVLTPCLRTLDVSARPPIDMSRNLPTLVFSFSPFRTLGQLSTQICHSAGGRGVPKFVFKSECSYFCYLGPHTKFQNPRTTFQNTPPVRPNMSPGGSPEIFCWLESSNFCY